MCKHWPESCVADALYALDGGVVLVIDDDTALVVDFDTNVIEVQVSGNGATANGDQDHVRVESFFTSSLSGLGFDEDSSVTLLFCRDDLGIELEFKALFCKNFLERFSVG